MLVCRLCHEIIMDEEHELHEGYPVHIECFVKAQPEVVEILEDDDERRRS